MANIEKKTSGWDLHLIRATNLCHYFKRVDYGRIGDIKVGGSLTSLKNCHY